VTMADQRHGDRLEAVLGAAFRTEVPEVAGHRATLSGSAG
jgi:hypothetical protein